MGPGGRGHGREGKVWKIVQCARHLWIFILGLCVAECIWGCWEGDFSGPFQSGPKAHGVVQKMTFICFLNAPFLPSVSSISVGPQTHLAEAQSPWVRGPPRSFCSEPALCSQPRQSCWGMQAHSTHQRAKWGSRTWGKRASPFLPRPGNRRSLRAWCVLFI